jgi:site-specific DNA-methyltransferase (adenine-specific)
MKPYYEKDGIIIYHGDCREILPSLSADVVLTDPPWLASDGRCEIRVKGVSPRKQKSKSLKYGTIGHFDEGVIRLCQKAATHDCFFFCGYRELAQVITASAPLRGVFGWHKPNGTPATVYPAKMDLSFIVWTGRKSLLYGYQHWPSMVFSVPKPNAGCMASERIVDDNGKAVHPAQGPLTLYARLLAPFRPGLTILDTYAGTGTTLRAAKDAGMKAIGIEIKERYCEIAARRLEQKVLAFE